MPRSTSLCGVVLASVFLIAASAPPGGQLSGANLSSNIAAVPNRRVHTVGDVWLKVGADGILGSELAGFGADPDSTTVIPAACEFPGGSSRQYLFGGGLWIGGMFGSVDTVVVASMRSTSSISNVLQPTTELHTGYDSSNGHQSFVANFADTAYSKDYDWGVPNPRLGLEVRQTSHAFESRPYDRFIIVEYLIRNISKETIRKVRVGIFVDPDVFSGIRVGQVESGPMDDVAGFLRNEGIAYTLDNDGDSWRTPSPSDPNWCPGAFGLAPITIDPIPCCTTFNWWATNWGNTEWGPYKYGSIEYPPLGSVLPMGSSAMYRTMANSEIDYDQIEAAIDKRDQGWGGPIAGAPNVANGLDTRWTLAYGFGDLFPNDSLRLVMAYVVGDSVHQTVGNVIDPADPDLFRRKLDFTDLVRNVEHARSAWSRRFLLERASPIGLAASFLSDRLLRLTWRPAPSPGLRAYRLLKRVSGEFRWTTISETEEDIRQLDDNQIEPGTTYEYAIESVYDHGLAAVRSRPIRIKAGVPPKVSIIRASNTPESNRIEWVLPPSGQSFATYALLNVYRRTEDSGQFEFYREVPLEHRKLTEIIGPARVPVRRDPFTMNPLEFVDDSVSPGVMYHYRLSLTNDYGIEGAQSNADSAMPMTLDRKGLVLLTTESSLCNSDTLRYFYDRWAAREGFDTLTPVVVGVNDPREPPRIAFGITGATLSRYQCLIWVNESPGGGSSISPGFYARIERYMTNGGKIVLITRNQGIRSSLGDTIAIPVVEKYFGVRGTQVERAFLLSGRSPNFRIHARSYFRDAFAIPERYPAIEADSALGWSVPGIPTLPFDDTSMIAGRIFEVGALDSVDAGTEILYRYNSAYDTTVYDNKPIAVKRITDSTAAILFNFPLSLMKHEQAWQALTQAVADLGIDTVNYWLPSTSITRGIIEWLYGRAIGTPDPQWDINRDGVIDIRDVVEDMDRPLH